MPITNLIYMNPLFNIKRAAATCLQINLRTIDNSLFILFVIVLWLMM